MDSQGKDRTLPLELYIFLGSEWTVPDDRKLKYGEGGEIRTPDTLTRTPVFKTSE
jgi:hypothetical protein